MSSKYCAYPTKLNGIKGSCRFTHLPSVATWLMPKLLMPRPVCVKPSNVAGPLLQQIGTSNDSSKDAEYEKWTVKKLRAALQQHGQPKTGRKAELLSRWKKFKEHHQGLPQGLLQQCEQLLPNIIAKVDGERFTYSDLTENIEQQLNLERYSLDSIRPQLKAAVTSYMSREQGCPQKQTSLTVSGRRKSACILDSFTWGCSANSEKARAEGADERATLASEIKRLSNFKRHLADGDKRLAETKRMLLIMKEKLNENINREGRKTVQRQEVDKAQCTLAVARTESDEVYQKFSTLGKSMAKNLQSFHILMEEGKAVQANTFEAGRKATILCNRILDGEIDKELDDGHIDKEFGHETMGAAVVQDSEADRNQHCSKRRRRGEPASSQT